MRRAAAVQTCLALVLAFFVAPFQHVHPVGSHHDHDAGLLHAHFHLAPASVGDSHDLRLEAPDDDDDHALAQSSDTFMLRLVARPSLGLPSHGPRVEFIPARTIDPVDVVEERGHDPPFIGKSNPRGPPS